MEDKRLVEEVSRYSFLYDPEVTHKLPGQNREAWENIARVFGSCTAEECKQRWRMLRDTYVRYYKKSLKNPGQRIPWRLYRQMTFLTPYILARKRNRFGHISSLQELDAEGAEEMEDVSGADHHQEFYADPHHQGVYTTTSQGATFGEMGSDEGKSPDVVIESVVERHDGEHQNYNRLMNCMGVVPPPIDPLSQLPMPVAAPARDACELYLLSLAPALRRLTPRNRARARIRIEMLMEELEFGVKKEVVEEEADDEEDGLVKEIAQDM